MNERQNVAELMAEAIKLVEAYMAETQDQNAILSAEETDADRLNASLLVRRDILDRLLKAHQELTAFGMTEAEQSLMVQKLSEVKALDDENIRLAQAAMDGLRGQARQMTENRKGVAGYGRAEIAGETSALFDKKQ